VAVAVAVGVGVIVGVSVGVGVIVGVAVDVGVGVGGWEPLVEVGSGVDVGRGVGVGPGLAHRGQQRQFAHRRRHVDGVGATETDGCASEAKPPGIRQCFRQIAGVAFEEPVLRPVRLVSDDDDVRASREHWVREFGLVKPELLNGAKDDLPALSPQKASELVNAGGQAHKEPWNAFWGQRYAQAKDPDGNVVDLFAPLAG